METVDTCPVCGNNQFNPFLVCKDYLVSNQEFTIQQCNQCTFRLTNPRPGVADIGAYYKSDTYVSHNDAGGGFINNVYRLVRNYTLQTKLDLIEKLNASTTKRLLDVGCGTGEFLKICGNRGWQVAGTEPDSDARSVASDKLQTDIKSGLEEVDAEQQYDIITLWHVLEHVADLSRTIKQLRKLLTDQGTLVVAVPNADSYDAKVFGRFWAAYDVPRHLYHFTPATFKPLFEGHGFRLIEQRPMPFDAFYVAMLSTRYKTGRTDYAQSIQVGIRSNAAARRTGNSSSLIYVLKKD